MSVWQFRMVVGSFLLLPGAIGRAENLIQNGDFSQGNVGFTSGYTYNSNLFVEGNYYIDSNPAPHHPQAASFGDHTKGSGLMLIANGAIHPNIPVWEETVPISPQTLYSLTLWARSWTGPIGDRTAPDLAITVNGSRPWTNFLIPQQTTQWHGVSGRWNSGSATTATIAITDANIRASGNDFALDDISFVAVPSPGGPLPTSAWAGLALLAGLGTWRGVRKRIMI